MSAKKIKEKRLTPRPRKRHLWAFLLTGILPVYTTSTKWVMILPRLIVLSVNKITVAAFKKSFRSLAPINEIGGWS